MTAAMLAGALAGAGLWLMVVALSRPKPGVAALVARIESGQRSMSTATITGAERASTPVGRRSAVDQLRDRFDVLAAERGWDLGRQRTDLALIGRSPGWLLGSKTVAGLGLMVIAPFSWGLLRLMGVPAPGEIPLVVALVLGTLGFFLPDLVLRSEAAGRRREFRRTVGIFLDLVAMNLAGGRGLPEALLAAATVSDHWSMIRIRQALANARLFGLTPWQALGQLGEELGIDELRDLSGALSLAADDGAKIRASLSARAATLRRKELAEVEGEAGERSQSMLVAQLLLCTAFLVFLGYPAVSTLLSA
ncbi:MAG: tight adherence protein [Actinomycetota bacterium]|nr:tight adherence protein [Actinomycetota bacterium]